MQNFGLGKRCWTYILAVRGNTDSRSAKRVVDQIVADIGMTPVFKPAVFRYDDDIGIIYIQPTYESFVAFDAWPCHGGGYLTVTSCKHYSLEAVAHAVTVCGYEIIDSSSSVLSIDTPTFEQKQNETVLQN